MKAVTETLGVARSNIAERIRGTRPKRGPHTRDGDLELSAEVSRMRDELLNETLFFDLDDACVKLAAWVRDYNDQRPHSALGYITPAAYAATFTATGERLRNLDQLRRSPVAPTAPHSAQSAAALAAAG